MLFRFLLCGLAITSLPWGSAVAQLPDSGFEVGRVFPVFSLPQVSGDEPLGHDVLLGRKSLVVIFASW